MNKHLLLTFTLTLLVAAAAAQPVITPVVYPRYLGSNENTADNGVRYGGFGSTPMAIYLSVDGLQPNTNYETHNSGALGLITEQGTSTRGSQWDGQAWISPSNSVPFGVSDASGHIERWVYVRTPSGYPAGVDTTSLRVRLRPVGASTAEVEYGPSNAPEGEITVLEVDSSATQSYVPGGAIIRGMVDPSHAGQYIFAYALPTDVRPLAGWLVQTEGHNDDGGDLNARLENDSTAGVFELTVPAGITVTKLEVRNEQGQVVATAAGAWMAGAPATITELNNLAIIPLPAEVTDVPTRVSLGRNYPNPFSAVSTVPFSLDKAQRVRLAVYDLLGREVAVLADGMMAEGPHEVSFNAKGLPSGMYLYRLDAGSERQMKTMVLIR